MHRCDPPIVLTHRGLEPARPGFFAESTYEAFSDHVARGFGVEFDVGFLSDRIIVTHDRDLRRITGWREERPLARIPSEDIPEINKSLENGRLCFLEELLDLISASSCPLGALHLKGAYQHAVGGAFPLVDRLLAVLERYPGLTDRLLVFDVLPAIAGHMRSRVPGLRLAPSVAHEHDIERYGGCVDGTLLTTDEALAHRHLYDWVWLDEWDLMDAGGAKKRFYTAELFSVLRSAGFRIALVTPELHATSPGLLGGEAHADAESFERLQSQIRAITSLCPDAICTDYPEKARQHYNDLYEASVRHSRKAFD